MRCTRLIWCGAWFLPQPVLRAADLVVSGPLLELPPMVVTSDQGPVWRHAEMPGYEILSCCPDEMTGDFMQGLARAEALRRRLVPDEFRARSDVPRVIILSTPENLALMPRELLGEGTSAPSLVYGGEALTRENSRIVPNIELGDPDCSMVFATLDPVNFDRDRFILHPAHVRDLLSNRRPPLPAWLVTGLANLYGRLYRAAEVERGETHEVRAAGDRLFSTPVQGDAGSRIWRETTSVGYRIRRDVFSIPALEWISAEATASLLKAYVDRKPGQTQKELDDGSERLLPLETMLAPPPSPESPAWPAWNAEATLFVRWAIEGGGAPRQAALWRYVARISTDGAATEDAFRDSFGLSYDQALADLGQFLPMAFRRPMEIHLAPESPVAPGIRPATTTELVRIREDWTRLVAGYLKTRFPGARPPEARHRAAIRACEKGDLNPRLLAAVGLYEAALGHDSPARKFLEEAVAAAVVRPRAYFELARLRYAAVRNSDGSPLGAKEARFATAPLVAGFAQEPALGDAYALAAKVWRNSQATVTAEDLKLINRGPELFPDDMDLLHNVALLNERGGDHAAAARLAERGLKLSRDPEMRAEFEALLSR